MSEDNHQECKVFTDQEDIDAMRQFTKWLRDGGMDSLREMKQCSDDYKALKHTGFKAVMKLIGIAIIVLLGIAVWTVTGKINPAINDIIPK